MTNYEFKMTDGTTMYLLGIESIERQADYLIFTHPKSGTHSIPIDSIEQLICNGEPMEIPTDGNN